MGMSASCWRVEFEFKADALLLADIVSGVLLGKAPVDAPVEPFASTPVPVRAAVADTPSLEGYVFDCSPDQKESYVRDVELKLNMSFVVSDVFLCPPGGFLSFEVDAVERTILEAPPENGGNGVGGGCDRIEVGSAEADEEGTVFCEAR